MKRGMQIVGAFFVSSVALNSAFAEAAPDVIKDESYNMPPAVTAMMGVDEAMVKMETAAMPAVLDAFKKSHPAPFWVFGEDRQLAVRNHIVPAHWFENGVRQHGKFSGTARPGEFYVFQACVLGGDKAVSNLTPRLTFSGALGGAETRSITSLPVAVGAAGTSP